MMPKTKLRTFTNLGALPPGKQMVKVEHTYDKTYTDYFYTVVDVTDERYVASVKTGRIACPDQLQQVRDRMAAGYMESFDYDEEETTIPKDVIDKLNRAGYAVKPNNASNYIDYRPVDYDVNDSDMKAAVDRWTEYEEEKK